jgi:hypothetical protein
LLERPQDGINFSWIDETLAIWGAAHQFKTEDRATEWHKRSPYYETANLQFNIARNYAGSRSRFEVRSLVEDISKSRMIRRMPSRLCSEGKNGETPRLLLSRDATMDFKALNEPWSEIWT